MALVCACLLPGAARAESELVTHTANAYGSLGMCSGAALSNANTDDDYFDNGFGSYDQIARNTDALVDGRDFTDYINFAWGADDVDVDGTDFADVVFFSGHSAASCTGSARVWLVPGDDNEGCTIYLAHVTNSSRHVTWGGGTPGEDTDIFVNFACQTAHYCAYTAGAYDQISKSSGQFNMLNGFHGNVYEVAGYQSDLGSYSSASTSNNVGDAWLDWLFDPNAFGTQDNCPSSIVYGANTSETDDFYLYSGWNDIHNNGARTTNVFYRLCDCDPDAGTALPC